MLLRACVDALMIQFLNNRIKVYGFTEKISKVCIENFIWTNAEKLLNKLFDQNIWRDVCPQGLPHYFSQSCLKKIHRSRKSEFWVSRICRKFFHPLSIKIIAVDSYPCDPIKRARLITVFVRKSNYLIFLLRASIATLMAPTLN